MKNQHKYTAIRLINFIRGLLFSLLYIPLPKASNRIIFCSSHLNCFNFNSKYLFNYFLKNNPDYECKFVINDDFLRGKLIKSHGEHFISNKTLPNLFYILGAKTWISSTNETPCMGILLNFNRKVFYLNHGAIFKNSGLLEKKVGFLKTLFYMVSKYNFSYIFTSSTQLVNYAAQMHGVPRKKIKVVGQPKNEYLYKAAQSEPNNSSIKKILYAPTWRKSKDVRLFPFEDWNKNEMQDYLEKNNIQIHLKLHPFYEQKDTLNYTSKNIHLLTKEDCPDISEHLDKYDGLITDYSSLFIDYMILERPLIFMPYDLKEFNSQVGFIKDYEQYTPGFKPKSQNEFISILNHYFIEKKKWNQGEYSRVFKFFNDTTSSTPSKDCAELIINEISTSTYKRVFNEARQ